MQKQERAAAWTSRLPDWLARRADTHPDVPAIVHGEGTWTYRELHERAAVLAGALRERDVAPGDRVAVLARHGLTFAWAVHGVMQAGATLVPINTRLTAPEIAWQLTDAGVRWLIHDERHEALALEAVKACGAAVRCWNLQQEPPQAAPLSRSHIDLGEVHVVIYTSGTTGKPKGALLTYGNQWWSAVGSALQLGVLAHDRWLVPMPLFHVGGLAVLMRSLIYGTTAVIHDVFDPHAVNDALDHDGITLLSVVPTMLQRMLDVRGDRPYPSQLRCVLLGGSSAPRPLLEACQQLGVPVAQSYGLSEANSQVATLAPQDGLRKLGSSGKPLLPTEIAIWKDGAPVPPGVAGEIVVRGPTVTLGYLNRPDATAEAFSGGWFHTGDIGYLDDEGYLYVLDRRTDLIVSGGENVYPAEIESVLHAHPAVAEAGVVGRDDPEWGEVPVAFVRLREGQTVSEAELIAFCRTQLAGYKVPKEVRFVDQLPRNASGKLLRRNLRAWL